jgi:hypothetical protein
MSPITMLFIIPLLWYLHITPPSPPPPIPKKAIKSIRAIRLVMGQGAQSYLARGKILHHQIQFQVSKKEHRKCPCHSIPTPFIYFEYEHGCTKKESCGL